jgi:Fe-S cluster biogenesis protein NfuA
MDHFTKNEKLFTDEPQAEDTKVKENDTEVVAMIKEIIETRIRPVVQEDGGDIAYSSFVEDTGVFLFFI